MPEIKAEFEVWCSCGKGICHLVSVSGNNRVSIDPCPDCLEKSRAEGYDEGYEAGYDNRKEEEDEQGS